MAPEQKPPTRATTRVRTTPRTPPTAPRRASSMPVLSRAQLRKRADQVIDTINSEISDQDASHEKIANYILVEAFDNTPAWALGPSRHTSQLYVELRDRAGATLDLSPTDLSRHTRIGALNEKLKTTGWPELRWSKKVALLPLLALKGGLTRLQRGLPIAARSSVRTLEDWVAGELGGKAANSRALVVGSRVITGTVNLGDPEAREALVKAARSATPARRAKFVEGVRAGLESMQSLLEALEEEGA